jgi:uncharacterized protein (TIGR02145 family)
MKYFIHPANSLAMLLMALATASADSDYSPALQTHFAKGTLGSPGKTRSIEMFFQNVFKSDKVYSVSGKSKTSAAEDAFSGMLTISGTAAGASCNSDETEIKGSYDLNEKESKTSGSFKGTFTVCEKSGKLSKASFKGDWVKHATGSKTPCNFGSYKSMKIGDQVWMAENLNYEAKGSKCYDNKPANCDKYGRLYDWVTAKAVCPSGWHLPSKEEWENLDFGDSETAGKKLKAASGWNENGNGLDVFGFTALPGGYGDSNDSFDNVGYYGGWWSSSEYNSEYAYDRGMNYSNEFAYWNDSDKDNLFSVRCVKD